MYIPPEVVRWRRDARTLQEAEQKTEKLQKKHRRPIPLDRSQFVPTLMCELGARRRGLDLEVAAADARRWWETGRLPLRVTPQA